MTEQAPKMSGRDPELEKTLLEAAEDMRPYVDLLKPAIQATLDGLTDLLAGGEQAQKIVRDILSASPSASFEDQQLVMDVLQNIVDNPEKFPDTPTD